MTQPADRREVLRDETGGRFTVWYGTSRKPIDINDVSKGYSATRDETVHYGMCTVYVPKSHKIGSLGSSWLRRILTRTDDRLVLKLITKVPESRYWNELATTLTNLNANERSLVIFLHGYNVSFSDAALRTAQLGYDLSIKGAMAFYSWPSNGTFSGYQSDEATIEASEGMITDFLVKCITQSGAQNVHVIAHSMGNRAMLRAVNQLASAAKQQTGRHFGQIILAAPDVDADVFQNLSAAYKRVAQRTTLYVSSRDKAVEASGWLHNYPRVGLMPPVAIIPGIDTVSVSDIDVTLLGHGYVADARELLHDMHQLLNLGVPPAERFGLSPVVTAHGTYWAILS